MLILRPIGRDVGTYYRRGPDLGHWLGEGADSLDLAGTPDPTELRRILGGRHPTSDEQLGHTHAHRRAGWDLIFAAPKSVSLLAAVAPELDAREVGIAHREAVAETMSWFAAEASWARRDRRRVAATGLVAAAFEHGNSAAGDPHVHTHVLVANLVRTPDGRWSALDSSALWEDRRMVGGIYSLALRHRLGAHGFSLSWRIDANGLADIVGVPREAIDAASFRHRQVRGDLIARSTAEGGDAGLRSSPRRAAFAASRTRIEPPDSGWRARLGAVGFGQAQVVALLGPDRDRAPDVVDLDGPLAAAVEGRLAQRASAWTRSDAVQALAGASQAGAAPAATMEMVAQLCRRSPAVGADRWTTETARGLDHAILDAAAPRPVPRAMVPERIVAGVLDDRPQLSVEARKAVWELVAEGNPVRVLDGTPGQDRLIEQATVLDAARAAWQAAGGTVALDASPADAARWAALTGLAPIEAGSPPAVVVVDRADRRINPDLLRLLQDAAADHTKVVLVAGGTLPARRHPRAAGLETLQFGQGGHGIPAPTVIPAATPQTATPQRAATEGGVGRHDPSAVESGRLVVCHTPADAIRATVVRWQAQPTQRRPVLVGLGPPEAEALNRAARAARRGAGEIGIEQVTIGGRPFAPGDRVLARRRGPVPAGTLGTVTEIARTPPALTVHWDTVGHEAPMVLSAWEAQRLTHGYATTPGLAARVPGPLLLLGDPRALPQLGGRDVTGVVVAPGRPLAPEPFDRLSRLSEHVATTTAFGPPTGAGRHLTRPSPPGQPPPPSPPGQPPSPSPPWPAREGWSLAEIETRRERLESRLRATLPPDVTGDQRRLAEDRAYARQRPGGATAAELADLARRSRMVAHGEAELAGWIEANRSGLVEWRDLGRQQHRRADLVAHAAVVDRDSPARDVAGPEPAGGEAWVAWREAVAEVARHAERWPEAALDVASERPPGVRLNLPVPELLSQRRRDQALRHLDRALGQRTGRALGVDSGLGL